MKKSGNHVEGPCLKFITLDGDPSHAANDDTIRKLVKSNASRSRKGLAGLQGSPNQTASSPVPVSNSGLVSGKSRFALSSRKPLKRVRRQAASHPGGNLKDKQQGINIPGPNRETGGNSLTNLNVPNATQCLSLGSHRSIRFQPQYSPGSLPVITKSKVQTMAQHFFSQVVDMQHLFYDLVGLSKRDEAIFHGSLSIASVYYDTGANDLFHCQQTLSLVSQRLSNCTQQTSDETIGAVGLLVIHNILTGTNEHSTLHMNGLQQMVRARGGLDGLPTRLRKTLTMIDIFHATTWDCCPRFPFIQPQDDFSATLKALSSLSEKDLRLLKAYEKSHSQWSMLGMLQILRILTAVRFSDPLAVFNRLALSDAIYLLEYQLLSPQQNLETELTDEISLQEAFRLAVFLYIDKVLREMPPLNIKGLVHRLIAALKSFFDSTHAETSIRPHLGVLLWIVMISRINAYNADDVQYLLEKLVDICGYLGFKQRTDFRRYLDEVGPALQPFSEQCEEISTQIEEFNHVAR
ncbi:uncharacterized protein PAC_20031 [Phialocephala subalpina]|uniref:Uncharacterized protein n=1 Tax=Phialocephala subalpina TaxID=576137 RepID=A0A1L7XYQ0_9HELO|nr:uncharacterized protein PAC_20031 [Phialocephala subalpina]